MHRRWLAAGLLLQFVGGATLASDFVGSEACADCHSDAYANWEGSHHDLAMQEATEATVLGDFNNASFSYHGVTSTFFRKDGEYWVRTDNPNGELADFRVAYVFGVYPLQQLLLPLPGGRLQALSIAWDARPADQGGQRWYHIYDGEDIPAGDPLHWTGPYHNWNARCAECHSTDVQKRFDAGENRYQTTYAEIDVGCEACHGPGARHLQLAGSDALEGVANGGFALGLAARGEWLLAADADIAHRSQPLAGNTQIDSCGRCHARRSTLGDYHYGADLLDTHRLATIEPPLYWPDGQIRDEVYVYGSFIQSKMHAAGVVCSNCHEPHSNALRAEGNGVCAQCHRPNAYDTPDHHAHPLGAPGSACVDCHMPDQIYMGVDARRDHSMRIPRPDLTLSTGSPNACTQCHSDRSASWALDTLRKRGVDFNDSHNHPGRVFHLADRGDLRALPELRAIIGDADQSAMLRGSAILRYGNLGAPDLPRTAAMLLASESALVRMSAVQALAGLPPQQRYLMLRILIDDPVLAVRLAVAQSLAAVPVGELRPKDVAALEPLFAEYEAVQAEHLDMPSVQAQLGSYWLDRGEPDRAAAALRAALAINSQYAGARLNLADLLRATGDDTGARALLEEGLAGSPDSGAIHHALGLLEIRAGNQTAALAHLSKAAELESEGGRHRFVYAIALHDTGNADAAVAALEALNTERPGNPDVLYALVNYSRELGDSARSERYAAQLQAVAAAAGLR